MECKVCRNPDSGTFYRVNCCRACAAFFRRTTQLKLRYRCNKNRSCFLNKDNRKFCRYCRMKRCIDLGMTREDYSDTSSDFYLDDSDAVLPNLEETCSSDEDDFYSTDNIYKDYESFTTALKLRLNSILAMKPSRTKLPYKLSLWQQTAAAFANHQAKWPNCTKEKLEWDTTIDIFRLMADCHKEFENVANFCMEIEPFTRLSLDQRVILMKKYYNSFMQTERSFVTISLLGEKFKEELVVAYNGQIIDYEKCNFDVSTVSNYSIDDLKSLTAVEDSLDGEFTRYFIKMAPDHFELMYLLLMSMWDLEGKTGLTEETLEIAKEVEDRISEELNSYYKYEKKMTNYAGRIYKLHHILIFLQKIEKARDESATMAKTFNLFKIDVHLQDLTF